jgi:hypothetical protein
MIRFFHILRQKLIKKKKIRTYIYYAIGEIFLVVIGILIALQVNNWNEYKKEQALAKSILSQLLEDITQDTIALNYQIGQFKKITDQAKWMIQKFEEDAPYENKMDSVLASITAFNVIQADYTAFNYLENVGIGIIKDQKLRDQISEYYQLSRHIASVERYFELDKYFRQEIYPKYFKKYRYGSYVVPNNYNELKKSTEISIMLDMCYNDAIFYRGMNQGQKERAEKLIELIKQKIS